MLYFLPHIGELNLKHKAYYLGYMVKRLLDVYTGNQKPTDRDSYSLKRIDTAGSLLLELYRELWGIFTKNVSLKIDNDFKFHFKDFGNEIQNLINDEIVVGMGAGSISKWIREMSL